MQVELLSATPLSVQVGDKQFSISSSAQTVGEALAAPSGKPVQVNYATQPGTAQPGADYSAAAGTLSWQPGQPLTNTVSVPILNDDEPEPPETFAVALSAPSNAVLGAAATSVVSIEDNDRGPPLVDNDGGATGVSSNSAVLNGYLGSDGGAATEAWVYWGPSDRGTNRGAWAASARVGIVGRGPFAAAATNLNPNTRYYYRCLASNAYGMAWADATTNFLTGPPTVQFAAAASAGSESNAAVNFEIRLTAPAVYGVPVSVAYSSVGGTAAAGADYTLPAGTAVIAPGASNAWVALSVVDDNVLEYDETAQIALSNAVNAVLGANRIHTYSIADNDPFPTVAFVGAPYAVAESAAQATVTVALASASEREVSVAFLTAGGTAAAHADYTPTNGVLRWGPGQSGPRAIAVRPVNDAAGRGDRTLYALLFDPVDCRIAAPAAARIAILEDDLAAPAVSNRPATGVRATRATVGAEILAGAPAPAAAIYWGLSDGGTNRAAWSSRADGGAPGGAFAAVLTNLLANRTYYYRGYATNAAGEAWAPATASFRTLNGRDYFVNDNSRAGDVFCTAIGDNFNSGLSPALPKATLAALLAAYDLAPGDTVYVDTGAYVLPEALFIDSDDTGAAGQSVAFIGSDNAAGTLLRAADSSQDVIYLSAPGFGYVRFERLRLTGGRHGLYARGSVDSPMPGIEVVQCVAYSNTGNSASSGIYLRDCAAAVVTDCEAYGNRGYGLRIYTCNGVTLARNRCDRQTAATGSGINVFQGSNVVLEENRCNGNGQYGIYVGAAYSTLAGNVCSSNGSDGVSLGAVGCRLLDNTVFANGGYGFYTPGVGELIRHNLAYSNALGNLTLYDLDNTAWIENNTLSGGAGLAVDSPLAVTNRHNIIWAAGVGRAAVSVRVRPAEAAAWQSDYNNLYATAGAAVGVWGTNAPSLALLEWQARTGGDANSRSADPLFVGGADFHLQSRGGSWHDGAWIPDGLDSPSLDAGDPAAAYEAEPDFSGLWVNQGAYGGTPRASRTYYDGPFVTLTIVTNPPGVGCVTVTPRAAAYPTNRPIALAAQATDPGFVFSRWAGAVTGTNAAATFTAASNALVEARFEPRGWQILATADPGGSIVPAGAVAVPDGGTQSFVIAASPPRYVADVRVDGQSRGITNAWTFANVRTNHTIHVVVGGTAVNTEHGTPIAWLEQHGFTNDYEAADNGDQDGDGALTWQEYQAGTVPTNSASVFRVLRTAAQQGSNYLWWYATTNSGVQTPFMIQFSTNLRVGPWVVVVSNIARHPSGTNVWAFPSASSAGPWFYRPALPPTNR